MKKIWGFAVVLFAILVLSGCGESLTGQNGVPGGAPAEQSVAKGQPAAVSGKDAGMISIQNFAFSPATLTVKKGATVTWTNNDSAMHTVRSELFTSGNLAKGNTFKFTFDAAGTFDYSCGIHPSMTGRIVVE